MQHEMHRPLDYYNWFTNKHKAWRSEYPFYTTFPWHILMLVGGICPEVVIHVLQLAEISCGFNCFMVTVLFLSILQTALSN